jgi:predicted GNAT family acetyltransferase
MEHPTDKCIQREACEPESIGGAPLRVRLDRRRRLGPRLALPSDLDGLIAMTRDEVDRIARETLAADCGSTSELFGSDGVAIVRARPIGGRRYQPARALMIVSYGAGAVVACSDAHFEWAYQNLRSLRQTQLFSTACISELADRVETEHPGWELGGPHVRFLCASDTLTPEWRVDGVEVRLLQPAEFAHLYARRADLSNALGQPGPENLDRLIAAAYSDGTLVAAAGVSEDAPRLWQIGVDTIADARRRGLASLVVQRLTARLLRDGIAPYYSTLISNLISQRVARSVGYWPAWIEMEARPVRATKSTP